MPPKRMTANPVKAPRYRPGKAVPKEESSSSESEEETAPAPPPPSSRPPPKASTAPSLEERRKLAAARLEEEKARRAQEEEGFVTASEEESSEAEGEGEEGSGSEEEGSSSEEEEESSEDEAPRRLLVRPKFVKKGARGPLASIPAVESAEAAIAAEEARKKAAADELVEEQIRKDYAAKQAGKKHWDDEEDEGDDVDDTDDVDPEAEYAAWKLRELKRIKREREKIEAREAELAEVERRKNLTEEERKAEDDEFLAKQQEEKDSKGKMGYLQKYYHKGAFFQDDAKAEGLDRRDIMGSRFADDVQNRELLPQALQMRDMTKLGKKGATKYRDLKTEDTGRWGVFDDHRGKGKGGGFVADERFAPDRDRGGAERSGANNMPVGERKRERVEGAPEGPRAMREGEVRERRDGGDTYRPRRDRSRSRSRSPRRDRDDRGRRKRSTSRDIDRYESDKRRRVDSR